MRLLLPTTADRDHIRLSCNRNGRKSYGSCPLLLLLLVRPKAFPLRLPSYLKYLPSPSSAARTCYCYLDACSRPLCPLPPAAVLQLRDITRATTDRKCSSTPLVSLISALCLRRPSHLSHRLRPTVKTTTFKYKSRSSLVHLSASLLYPIPISFSTWCRYSLVLAARALLVYAPTVQAQIPSFNSNRYSNPRMPSSAHSSNSNSSPWQDKLVGKEPDFAPFRVGRHIG